MNLTEIGATEDEAVNNVISTVSRVLESTAKKAAKPKARKKTVA
jgi:hypothetical protein